MFHIKVKNNLNLEQAMKAQGRIEVYHYSFFNLGARWIGWSTPRPDRFTPVKEPVPTEYESGWAPGPVWTGSENFALTGI